MDAWFWSVRPRSYYRASGKFSGPGTWPLRKRNIFAGTIYGLFPGIIPGVHRNPLTGLIPLSNHEGVPDGPLQKYRKPRITRDHGRSNLFPGNTGCVPDPPLLQGSGSAPAGPRDNINHDNDRKLCE